MRKIKFISLIFLAVVLLGCNGNTSSKSSVAGAKVTVLNFDTEYYELYNFSSPGIKPGMTGKVINYYQDKDDDVFFTIKVNELNKKVSIPAGLLLFSKDDLYRTIPAFIDSEEWPVTIFYNLYHKNIYLTEEESVDFLNKLISYTEDKGIDLTSSDYDCNGFDNACHNLLSISSIGENKTNIHHILAEKTCYKAVDSNFGSRHMKDYDENHRTPVTRAIIAGNYDTVRYFYENSAYLKEKDSFGKTAMDYVMESDNEDIKKLLSVENYDFVKMTLDNVSELRKKQSEYLPYEKGCLIQYSFKTDSYAYVIAETEVVTDNGESYKIEPGDQVKILYDVNFNLYENKVYDFVEKDGDYPVSTFYPYYYVRKDNSEPGIISGKYIAHSVINDSYPSNFDMKSYKFYVSYKTDNTNWYADVYEYNGSSMRKYNFVRPEGIAVIPEDFNIGPFVDLDDIPLLHIKDCVQFTHLIDLNDEQVELTDKMILFYSNAISGDDYSIRTWSFYCVNNFYAINSLTSKTRQTSQVYDLDYGEGYGYDLYHASINYDEESNLPVASLSHYQKFYDGWQNEYVNKCHTTYYKFNLFQYYKDYSEDTDESYDF